MEEKSGSDFDSIVKQERTRMGSEMKRQKDTARLVWASKPRKEHLAKYLVFQTTERVCSNKAAGALTCFFGCNTTTTSKT